MPTDDEVRAVLERYLRRVVNPVHEKTHRGVSPWVRAMAAALADAERILREEMAERQKNLDERDALREEVANRVHQRAHNFAVKKALEATERVEKLERELADAERRLLSSAIEPCQHANYVQGCIPCMGRELAALREDRERLDWLEAHMQSGLVEYEIERDGDGVKGIYLLTNGNGAELYGSSEDSLRAAIDAARKGET